MTIKEAELTEAVQEKLIALSRDWEKENICHGYHKNAPSDIEGNRIFLAMEEGDVIGYLFGHGAVTDKTTSVYHAGTRYFEIEEIYVTPAFRGQGIGKQLFRYAEKAIAHDADMILLGTATKNFRAILHFYIDELGMEFWSARLFKKLR